MKHFAKPIIQTDAHTILKQTARMALETARLAIVRGPAGIGKSFGLQLLQRSLSKNGDDIFLFTATARNGKSTKRFFDEMVLEFGFMGYGSADPMQRLQRMLMRSFPLDGGPRILLIIDECQHLNANLIECLRALYDMGEKAHSFNNSLPAFGLLLVGNGHFLSRGGKAERAAFEALLSRCPIEVTLERPEPEEYEAFAKSFFADNADLSRMLADHGQKNGNLRVMDTAHDLARHFSNGDVIAVEHLQRALMFAAGSK